jgi:hypothetical protein
LRFAAVLRRPELQGMVGVPLNYHDALRYGSYVELRGIDQGLGAIPPPGDIPGTAGWPVFLPMNAPVTEPNSSLPRLLYTRLEAAYKLSLSVRSLDYYIATKRISTRRMGRKVLVPHGELVRFSRMDHTDDIRQ